MLDRICVRVTSKSHSWETGDVIGLDNVKEDKVRFMKGKTQNFANGHLQINSPF